MAAEVDDIEYATRYVIFEVNEVALERNMGWPVRVIAILPLPKVKILVFRAFPDMSCISIGITGKERTTNIVSFECVPE